MFDLTAMTSSDNLDCGATCLRMLMDYYGVHASQTEVSAACHVREIGCTAGDIKRAGVAFGLDMRAWRVQATDLLKYDCPALIWWRYNHWMVFGGMDADGRAWIFDPDRGKYRMRVDTFGKLYCGVAITVGEPGEIVAEPDATDALITRIEGVLGLE